MDEKILREVIEEFITESDYYDIALDDVIQFGYQVWRFLYNDGNDEITPNECIREVQRYKYSGAF